MLDKEPNSGEYSHVAETQIIDILSSISGNHIKLATHEVDGVEIASVSFRLGVEPEFFGETLGLGGVEDDVLGVFDEEFKLYFVPQLRPFIINGDLTSWGTERDFLSELAEFSKEDWRRREFDDWLVHYQGAYLSDDEIAGVASWLILEAEHGSVNERI